MKKGIVRHRFVKARFKRHFHLDYSIGLILDGVHKLEIEKQNLAILKGEIKIINPHQLHIANGDICWEYANFMPENKKIEQIASEVFLKDFTCKKIRFKNSIKDTYATKLLLNFFHSKPNTIEQEENFILFVAYILRFHSYFKDVKREFCANIKDIVEFLHVNFLNNISLEDISKISPYSKYYLIKTFKKHLGITPHQYIMVLRVEYAKKLIAKKMPLIEVALESGFSDQSHFIRIFKRNFGYTPTLLL